MDLGLSGKRFCVTGGTRGIGRAVVEGLLAEGAAVAYCARSADAVAETQAALTADGATAIGSAVDVADAAALAAWVSGAADAWAGWTAWWPTSARWPSRRVRRTGAPASRST